jgi:transcriptional regulator with XRE-family HTH domain
MSAAAIVRLARQRTGLSLRQLAARADTPYSTLAAYEAGRVHPSFDKVRHIVEHAGFDLEVTLFPRPGPDDEALGRELEAVLEPAE